MAVYLITTSFPSAVVEHCSGTRKAKVDSVATYVTGTRASQSERVKVHDERFEDIVQLVCAGSSNLSCGPSNGNLSAWNLWLHELFESCRVCSTRNVRSSQW